MNTFSKAVLFSKKASAAFLDLVFPRICLGCKRKVGGEVPLCAACEANLRRNTTFFCGSCRARLPYGKKICHRDCPYVLGAAGDYRDETLRNLIHGLKFEGVRNAAAPLGEFIARYLVSVNLAAEGFAIVPVPLSPERERKRGFNQSFLIANALAERLHLPVLDGAVIKIKNAPPQSEAKDRETRSENVQGCFAVTDPTIIRRNILLVDDVTTSGATLHEVSRCLKRAGAKTVIAAVAAKA